MVWWTNSLRQRNMFLWFNIQWFIDTNREIPRLFQITLLSTRHFQTENKDFSLDHGSWLRLNGSWWFFFGQITLSYQLHRSWHSHFRFCTANVLFDKDIISLETTEWESHFLLKPSGLLSGNLPWWDYDTTSLSVSRMGHDDMKGEVQYLFVHWSKP